MKVTLLFGCLLLLCCFGNSEAHISIHIDPEDLDRVSEFFHTIIINNHQPHPQLAVPVKFMILSNLKKGIVASFHLVGVVIALVSASVISTHVTTNLVPVPVPVPVHQQEQPEFIQITDPTQRQQQQQQPELIQYDSNIFKKAEMCDIDYGCNRNACWRSCNRGDKGNYPSLWCHTASNPRAREHHRCDDSKGCSSCWECIEPCHT